jgi:uncharacterized membrane protein YfcA
VSVTAIGLGVLIGLALGLLGGGGSILAVPVFVYVLHLDPKQAIAMSLAVVGVTSAVGTAGHWRAGNVNLRVGTVFGSVAMVGTYLGTRIAAGLSGATQLAVVGIVMLAAAALMFRRRGDAAPETTARPAPRGRVALVVLAGVAVGVLTGVAGVGGGFLIVPALVLLALPMGEAVGTSLAIIAMNSAVGAYGYLGHVSIDWRAATLLTAGTVPGIVGGVYLHRFVPQPVLRRGFAVFLVLVAAFILYQNLGAVVATGAGRPS